MKYLKPLLGALALISTLAACSPSAPNAQNPVAVTKTGDTYTVDMPLASFSDFIVIETQMGTQAPRIVSLDEAVAGLSAYDAIFVGEAHGHAASHYVQSKIFAGLHAGHKDMALSMEQFERSQQGVMDDYLAGKIGEETLIHDGKAWDHYRSSYRPLVEFAKNNGLPVIAAEVPANLVSCIGERGAQFLETLKPQPRAWAARTLHLEDGAYKDKFYGFMQAAAGHRAGGDLSEAEKAQKRFRQFSAQASRDDTMAESIFDHMQAHPGRKILHVNGSFHSAGLLGTPERVALRAPNIAMANVHPILVDDPAAPSFDVDMASEGQYIVLLYPTPKRFVQMKNVNAFVARTKGKIDEKRCAY
ncbi:MAG: ChaN family lipoprotein [Robiginitomaculum sp.]